MAPTWQPTTIADVIASMERIDAALPRKDGVAYFNRLYLAVTKAVQATSTPTTFKNPRFLSRLDVVFAGMYFDAEATLGSGAPCPVAWRPLMETRTEKLAPIQFALAGMNAHINHDLALALVEACEDLGIAIDDLHSDFEAVNGILHDVERQVAGWFETGLIADIEDVIPKDVDRALAMWSIVAAREVAWGHAEMLWRLRSERVLYSGYADMLARTTELAGRALLV
jgi:Family of unknown function (DUF5995)